MPKNNSKARRAERHAKAVARQAAHDALSVDEKLTKLAARGFTSGREVKRLEALRDG